jgi:hypothetical protein
MLKLERMEPTEQDVRAMDAFADRVIFQTPEWGRFIATGAAVEPAIAAVKDGAATVGYFTGFVVRRFGIRILASPMRGWSTWYMGFNLAERVSRREAAEALARYAFGSLGCLHLELRDRSLSLTDVDGLGYHHDLSWVYEVDLRRDEEEIFARMTSACRRAIRKAQHSGVVIEEATDREFADDYYAQLREVYAKQALVPGYGIDRVRALIDVMQPTGRLLLLRARDPAGRCIATGIFPAMNTTAYFWGGASWRAHQILRPNEAILWYAMRYWRRRGIQACDLGGGVERYKSKYGAETVYVPFLQKSRHDVLSRLRTLAKYGYQQRERLRGRLAR